MKNINWQLIGEAVEFYKSHGFEYIETPWIVPTNVMQITCPHFDDMRELNNGYRGMVGSAIHRRLKTDGYSNFITRTS